MVAAAAAPGVPALALDIGGTKLASAVVDPSGRVLGRSRCPTPGPGTAEELYEALLVCAIAALRGADLQPGDLAGIGVAAPGPMRWPEGVVSPLNMPAWRDFPLRDRLAAEFATDRVLLHNDAVAIVVGEHWRGAGRGAANLLGVTVSTGVGGGLILGGRVHHGASGNGGHVGHVVAEPDGPPCRCGGRGCLEAVAAGPNATSLAIADGWRPGGPATEPASTGTSSPDLRRADRPPAPDGAALAAAALAGDPAAARGVARAGRALGRVLASVAALLDLERITVGGGFSGAGAPLWGPLRATFAEHAGLAFAAACRIEPGALGGQAGLFGAAAFVLAPERYAWPEALAAD